VCKSREWLFERVRRDRRVDSGVPQRELAQKYGVSRNSVAAALVSPVPPKRKSPPRGEHADPSSPADRRPGMFHTDGPHSVLRVVVTRLVPWMALAAVMWTGILLATAHYL
jgi:hypothetical protein